MTDDTLHPSDDEREIDRLRARVAEQDEELTHRLLEMERWSDAAIEASANVEALKAQAADLARRLRLANAATIEAAEYVTELVREERESCASLADGMPMSYGDEIAVAIRARGSK